MDLLSIINFKNLVKDNSFDLKSIEDEEWDNGNDYISIAYLKKDDIPEIKIINKNLMLYDKQEMKINDYIKRINEYISDSSKDLLDDYLYDRCKICKNNLNKYFCQICNKNICYSCYKECQKEKHIIILLEEMEINYKNYIKCIQAILNMNILPMKKEINTNNQEYTELNQKSNESKENKINNDCLFAKKDEDKYKDILLIVEVISNNYNN